MEDLKIGDKVPDFQTKDLDGNPIQISDYVGKKTLLCFFRFASCPLCSVRVAQIIQNYPEYKKQGLNVIAVFESSPEYVKRYINDKRKVPFPIIPDLEGELYKLYNVKKSIPATILGSFRIFKIFKGLFDPATSLGFPDGSVARVPADFLIGPLLTIKDSYYGSDIGDHIPMNRINQFAKA